ncbi:MAG TPA: hypothetical protein VKV29_00500 [Chthonomonas sp.]|uniref:hypothetical protein n=1 Tax=Chthonomonas sp. TaxID=2282153 RepID=UPI002B4B1D7D|nr:hypothetical protein [Chthonomonas sp.]HLH78743.1 hypothetical protein [Chthonomonas sp.]
MTIFGPPPEETFFEIGPLGRNERNVADLVNNVNLEEYLRGRIEEDPERETFRNEELGAALALWAGKHPAD